MDKKQLAQRKEFAQQLKDLFNMKFSRRFMVLFKKPRFWIFFAINFALMMGRYPANAGVFITYLIMNFALLAIALSGFPEWLIKKLEDVRHIATSLEHQQLDEVFTSVLCDCKMEKRRLQLYIVDTMEINALTIGSHTLAITRGAMEHLNADEIKGVIAHELGHIQNGDGQIEILIKTLNVFYMWQFYILSAILNVIERSLGNDNIFGNIILFFRTIVDFAINIVMFISTAIISSSNRKLEFKADRYASKMGYNINLTSALYKLYNIQVSDKKQLIGRINATHPRIAYRIENLEKLAKSLNVL